MIGYDFSYFTMKIKVFIQQIIIAFIAVGIATAAIAGWMEEGFHPRTPELPGVGSEEEVDRSGNDGVIIRNEGDPEGRGSEADASVGHSDSMGQTGDLHDSEVLPVVRLTRSPQVFGNRDHLLDDSVADEDMGAVGGLNDDDLLEMDGPANVVEMITVPLTDAQDQEKVRQIQRTPLDSPEQRITSFQNWNSARESRVQGAFTDSDFNRLAAQLADQNLAVMYLPDEHNSGFQFYVVCVDCGYYLGAPEQVLAFYRKKEGQHSNCHKKKVIPPEARARARVPKYSPCEARRSSYREWPHGSVAGQSASEMAEAGFYYVESGDKVRCFYCDLGVNNWEMDDVPQVEHYRWNPGCGFLLGRFGEPSLRQGLIVKQNAQFRLLDQEASRIPPQQMASDNSEAQIHSATRGREGRNPHRNTIDREAIENSIRSMRRAGVELDQDLLGRVMSNNPGVNEDRIVDLYMKGYEKKAEPIDAALQGQSTGTVRQNQEREIAVRTPSHPLEHQAQSDRSSAGGANPSKPKKEAKRQPGKASGDREPGGRPSASQATIMPPGGTTVTSNEAVVQIGTPNRVIARNGRSSTNNDAVYEDAREMILKKFGQIADDELFNNIAINALLGQERIGARDILKSYEEALSKKKNERK